MIVFQHPSDRWSPAVIACGDDAGGVYADECVLDSLERGESPLFATQALPVPISDRSGPEEREKTEELHRDLVRRWAEHAVPRPVCAVYTDCGLPPSVQQEIEWATRHGMRVEFRSLRLGTYRTLEAESDD